MNEVPQTQSSKRFGRVHLGRGPSAIPGHCSVADAPSWTPHGLRRFRCRARTRRQPGDALPPDRPLPDVRERGSAAAEAAGPAHGHPRPVHAVETIVAAAIAKALPRPTPTRLVERIHARCRDADLPLPHRRTICARLAALGAGAPAVVRSTGERGMGRPPTPDCTTAPRPGDRGRPACSGCLMTDFGRLARRRTG